MKNINLQNNQLFKLLKTLPLEKDTYVIMGSGIMFALGIRSLEELDDIDILVSQKGWEKVKDMAENHIAPDWKCEHIYLFDNKIEIYNGWCPPGVFNPQEFLDSAVEVDGFRFCSPQDTIKWKKYLGREKDLKHSEMIENYLKSQ